MRLWTVAIVVSLLFGCAARWTPQEIRKDIDIFGRVAVRALELKENPTVTPESCRCDIELLNEVAEWLSDLIDGGKASQSEGWKKYDGFRELLTGLGCPFIPERGASSGAPIYADYPPRNPLASHLMAKEVQHARTHDRRVCTRSVPRDGAHRSIPGAGSPSSGTTHTRDRERCGDPGNTRYDTRHRTSAGVADLERSALSVVTLAQQAIAITPAP